MLTKSGSSAISAAEKGIGGPSSWMLVRSSCNTSFSEKKAGGSSPSLWPLRFLITEMDRFDSSSDDFNNLYVAL